MTIDPEAELTKLAEQHSRNARLYRRRRAKRCADCWSRSHEWISFAHIAEWCAVEGGSIIPDEARRQSAYQQLLKSFEAGEFDQNGRSRVLCLNPDTKWAKLTHERLTSLCSIIGV